LSYQWIALGCAVTALVTGALGAAAAGEPSAKSAPQAEQSARPISPHAAPGAKPPAKAPAAPLKKVDINNASLEELKTRLQLGDAEARKIIKHRPYKSKGELVTKAKLPEGVYQTVKRKVELQTPRKAAAKP